MEVLDHTPMATTDLHGRMMDEGRREAADLMDAILAANASWSVTRDLGGPPRVG